MGDINSEKCPVCEETGLIVTVKRFVLPAMQNYVFDSSESARNAKKGQFELLVCPNCGFAFNALFDPLLLDYDAGYDNSVPSVVMEKYYRELSAVLYEKYSLEGQLVVDIGCGKGTFLKIMCAMFPGVRGLGIDPSYEGEESFADGRLSFINDFFLREHINERPALVLCRHVLEYIPQPLSFFRMLHSTLSSFPQTFFFFEVPDLEWIIENNAFWDFCYEHCNYFTPDSFSGAALRAGFKTLSVSSAFGGQYLWLEAQNLSGVQNLTASAPQGLLSSFLEKLKNYTEKELVNLLQTTRFIDGLKNDGYDVTLWGMATKGVIFSLFLSENRKNIDFCIDVNRNKQGCFVPLNGHKIESPEALRRAKNKLAIIVMNPNYAAEIRETCISLSLDYRLLDAGGCDLF